MDMPNYQKGYRRVNPRRSGSVPVGSAPDPADLTDLPKQPNIVDSGFYAVWRALSRPESPKPMTGMFTASSSDKSYLGFVNAGEIWEFDHAKLKWRQITLKGARVGQRRGCSGAVYNGDLVVFGGKSSSGVLCNELLKIDTNTGVVSLIPVSLPELAYSVLVVRDGRVFIWGGVGARKELNSTLFEVDISSGAVARYSLGVPGRKNPGSFLSGESLFVYGGSRDGLLRIDLAKKAVELIETSGTPPPPEPTGGRFGQANGVILYFGGKGSAKYAPLYALNLERRWWFVFPVVPDGLTASIADGRVNTGGYFCLPRVHSFGMCYWEPERTIMAFPGSPEMETPVVSILALGEALPVVTLRDDMLKVLELGDSATAGA